ncbi:minor tail protein [Mycobacterium phage Kumao]|uniref:Minor tail protein n=1 Tax=Mycobacterium phage Kumao TaxID=2041344 RepID=A0A2D1GPV2_9CAUD|nr:minor tail protein [Mycobacterium phage Kumao]ATN93995.1 minor tail protein [Mycobacterium phage Kumao]
MADTFWWAELFVHSTEGIPSAETFGSLQLTFGGVEVRPTGIESAESFGATVVIGPPQFILPSGIPSEEAFGQMATGAVLTPLGVPSAEEFGTPTMGMSLHATGIPSAEAVSNPLFILPSKPEVVGFNINNGNSVTMPAHEPGDLLLILAYNDGVSHPSIPSASGSVPSYWNIHNDNGNTNSIRVAAAWATSTSHTSGTWSNTSGLAVCVIRGADPLYPIGYTSLGFGSGSNQSVAPALANVFDKTGKSQQLIYMHGHKTVTSWGSAPTGFTRLGQVNTELAINLKDDTSSDGAATQTATTSSSSGYAGSIIEVKQPPVDGAVTTRYWAGSTSGSNGNQTQYYGEGDRVLLFMSQDRAFGFNATVDSVPLQRIALVQYEGSGGTPSLAIYLSEPLSEGNHTLAWSGGTWYCMAALQVSNVAEISGVLPPVVDTGNGSYTVGDPESGGGRIYQAFGVGANASFGNPTGGNWRWVVNNSASVAVSDWHEATTFQVTKNSTPQWASLAIDLSPLASEAPRYVWERPPVIFSSGLGGSVSGSVEAVAGDTLIVDLSIDRGTTTPPTLLLNGNPMTLAGSVSYTGNGDGMLCRYIAEDVPGGTLTITSGSIATAWWAAQAMFVRNATVGATTSVNGSGSPSQSVTLSEGEFALQTFTGLSGLTRARGGVEINYYSGSVRFATQLSRSSTTFTTSGSVNHAGLVTKFS